MVLLSFRQPENKKTVSLRDLNESSNRGNPVNDAVINTKPQGFAMAYRKNVFRQPEWLNAIRLKRLTAFVLPVGKTGLPRFFLRKNLAMTHRVKYLFQAA